MKRLWVIAPVLAACLCTAVAQPTPAEILSAATVEQRVADLERRTQDKSALERRDLDAQEAMATSARDLATLTIVQIWLTIFGTAGLLITIAYTHRALAQGREALELERIAKAAELRAYIEVRPIGFKDYEVGKEPIIRVKVTNKGQTPARNVATSLALRFEPATFPYNLKLEKPFEPLWLAPGGSTASQRGFGSKLIQEQLDQIENDKGGSCFEVVGEVTYDDVFDQSHTTRFGYIYWGANVATVMNMNTHNDGD